MIYLPLASGTTWDSDGSLIGSGRFSTWFWLLLFYCVSIALWIVSSLSLGGFYLLGECMWGVCAAVYYHCVDWICVWTRSSSPRRTRILACWLWNWSVEIGWIYLCFCDGSDFAADCITGGVGNDWLWQAQVTRYHWGSNISCGETVCNLGQGYAYIERGCWPHLRGRKSSRA